MIVCTNPGCQTTAGCKCSGWWQPPQVPTITAGGTGRSLSEFSDEEIAREHRYRMMALHGLARRISEKATGSAT